MHVAEDMRAAKKAIEQIKNVIMNNMKNLKWQFTWLLSESDTCGGVDLNTVSLFLSRDLAIESAAPNVVGKLFAQITDLGDGK